MYHRRIQCRRNAFSSSSGSTPVFQETYCTWPLSFLLPPGKPHSILKCWLRVCCIFVCPKMAWLPMLGYTHAQMFMHAIARRSRTNTLGESAPKPNSGIKIHCVTGSQIWTTGQDTQPTETRLWEKNLLPHRGLEPASEGYSAWLFGETLYQLSCSRSIWLQRFTQCYFPLLQNNNKKKKKKSKTKFKNYNRTSKR